MTNETIAAIAGRHPDRFIPFAGADVMRGAAAVQELESCIAQGFHGLSLRPFMIGWPAPDLIIIMSHAGYPWDLDACLIAWQHPNLYIELGAHRPKYLARPGTSWEPPLRYGQTTIRHKILYGTGAVLLAHPLSELCDEVRALPLNRETLNDWLWRNASRLLAGVTTRAASKKAAAKATIRPPDRPGRAIGQPSTDDDTTGRRGLTDGS